MAPSLPGSIKRAAQAVEVLTTERCWITENWNESHDPAVSIARARVEPGVTTQRHHLKGISERYLIAAGRGVVKVGDLPPASVGSGDVVFIPEGVAQNITNDGDVDLVFYCICVPRFRPDAYEALE